MYVSGSIHILGHNLTEMPTKEINREPYKTTRHAIAHVSLHQHFPRSPQAMDHT